MHRSAVLLLVLVAGCELSPSSSSQNPTHDAVAPQVGGSTTTFALVAGAGYTTFDATLGGCLDSKNGINCNNYVTKTDVYMSGGPVAGGLSDGDYYFAVLTPSAQSGGFVEASPGNLSDQTVGGTSGDSGGGDALANRTFSVSQQQVVQNFGTHPVGTSPDGRLIIGLAPFDDTDDPGGVYILAICRIGAVSPSDCKYDAFKVQEGSGGASGGASVLPFSGVSGGVYYDANANGAWDSTEPGLPGWPISYVPGGTLVTAADGTFSASMVAGSYAFDEARASGTWIQTGNAVSQCTASNGASCTLESDRTYSAQLVDGSEVTGLFFGNVCVGPGGGHSPGYWADSCTCMVTPDDLTALGSLCLQQCSGQRFSPSSTTALKSWFLSTNMASTADQLSLQLAAMELNLRHGFVSSQAMVRAPGVANVNANGFIDVGTLVADAQSSLCGGTDLSTVQLLLVTALNQANSDLSFVQTSPASCPAPVSP